MSLLPREPEAVAAAASPSSGILAAELGPAVMADDPCEAAFGSADPPGPRKYYRARYYDPKIGRFVSEDPIGFGGGVNFYAYVANNPVTFADPSGLVRCVRWRSGAVTCVEDPSLCLQMGWCDEIPDPRANANYYQDCLNASNPPWLSHVSNFSTLYGAAATASKRLVGGVAAGAMSVGIASYQLTLPATCALVCRLDACSRW